MKKLRLKIMKCTKKVQRRRKSRKKLRDRNLDSNFSKTCNRLRLKRLTDGILLHKFLIRAIS